MRVKGHALINEGVGYPPGLSGEQIVKRWAFISHDLAGVGVCHCGAKSGPLPSDAARKRWHREHKAEVFVCESCGQPAGVTLKDGSFWCQSCDGSARRLGYAS